MDLNQDVVSGKWKQFRGRVREKRGEIARSEFDRALGRFTRYVGLLQESRGIILARFQRGLKRNARMQGP